MLHTLSHQWPTPSEPIITDPVTLKVKVQSESERCKCYFDRIDKIKFGTLIPVIENCLNNPPMKGTSIVALCEQLRDLIEKEHVPSIIVSLYQKLERKNREIKTIRSKLQVANLNLLFRNYF